MVETGSNSRPKLVGGFIRQKREAAGLSQRALGQLFSPPVTTQFISNLERGVTPLPLNHVPTLTRALGVNETEMMALLEQEYALKISGRLARLDGVDQSLLLLNPFGGKAATTALNELPREDAAFMQSLLNAYQKADPKTKDAFATVCENMLNVPRDRQ